MSSLQCNQKENRIEKERIMKKIFFTILIGMLLTQTVFALEKVNDFRLDNLEGKKVSLSQFQKEGLVVLDFWALWCSPCKAFMPKLNELHNKYEKLNVVTINMDKPRAIDKAKNFIRSNRYDFEVLFDTNQSIQKKFNVTSIPRTIVVDSEGNVIYDHIGYQPGDEKKLEEVIMKWLEIKPIGLVPKTNAETETEENENK
jgi:thiol-disulfide isomerase/thioredoxin